MIKTKKWIASFLEMGDIMRYPDHWPKRYNACSEPCDVIDGPCCCGAWHSVFDFQAMIVAYGFEDDKISSQEVIDEYADQQLEAYREFCKQIETELPPFEKSSEKFQEAIERNRKRFDPTVEENQRKRTHDNLRGVFE